jgi:hypothetical protein
MLVQETLHEALSGEVNIVSASRFGEVEAASALGGIRGLDWFA